MTNRPRPQTTMEVLIGTRESLRYLLGEVEAIGMDDVAEVMQKALEVTEAAIRRRLS